ncbi:MAG TPA: SRPBCC domain-containing protein [Pseudolabrys sp.]|nr:SRPBCC domain-containing protein [Pseudolabrys sp.]
MVFSWAWKSTPERETLVTVTFKGEGSGTLLTITHEQFFDEEARDRHRAAGTARWRSWKNILPHSHGSYTWHTQSCRKMNGWPRARRCWQRKRNSPKRATN